MKPWGKITKHLGGGVFEIKPERGAGVVIAQVLPAPGQVDTRGFVWGREEIEVLAETMIGREVTAEAVPGLSVVGTITKSHKMGGFTIVDAVDIERVEVRQ